MIGDLHNYMKVGIVHFMAYPETGKGEAQVVLDALNQTASDVFFGAIEVTRIKDPALRQSAGDLLGTAGLAVGYGAQPVLLGGKLDLNSADPAKRAQAVSEIKACVDEAYAIGARRLAVLSGPDPAEDDRPAAMLALVDSLKQICAHAKSRGDLGIVMEVFDRKIDKKCLIGSTAEAAKIAQAVREEHPSFGLMIDLSHLPLQEESADQCVKAAAPYLVHVHIGNCVLKDRGNPAYGDLHPRFGYPGGENDVPETAEFLRRLLEVGYIGPGSSNVVAFEVKPMPGETSAAVVANAKRTLQDAWARV